MKRLTFLFSALMMFIGVQAAKTYDLIVSDYEADFFEQNNDVYMLMHTEGDAISLRLDIVVEAGQHFFTDGKTYTWDNMIHTFCYAYVRDEYKEYHFQNATFTWHLDELGLEHIAGSATDTLGNIYNFRYDVKPFIPTGDTLDITFTKSLKLEHSGEWYFSGTEGEYYVLFTLLKEGNSPVGHYTSENIDLNYSYIDRPAGDTHQIHTFHHADIDITEAANDTFLIEALVAAMDTNVYRLHMFYVEPKTVIKDTIIATDLYINTDYLYGMIGAFQVEASSPTHYVKFAFSPNTDDLNIYDTYTISNITPSMGYVTNYLDPEEDAYEVYEGTVTISKTDSGAVLTGTILCYNGFQYTLHLSHFVPQKTREESLTMENLELQPSTGAFRISGYNADYTQYISLVLNNTDIAGSYDYVKTSPLYSYVVTNITWNNGEVASFSYFEVVDADLQVELDAQDSIVTVTGTLRAQLEKDVPEFTVSLKSKAKSSQGIILPASEQGKATKRMENGIIIIEKNGVKYTILGNVIQ